MSITKIVSVEGSKPRGKLSYTNNIPENSNSAIVDEEIETYDNGDMLFDDREYKTIDLSKDNELTKRINNSNDSKYNVIRNYLFEILGNQIINLPDGKKAIVDKRDAKHIAHNASTEKTSVISQI